MEIKINAKEITTFDTFSEWVNKASSRLSGYRNDEIICVDKNNDVVLEGKDMMHARDNKLFPVKVYVVVRSSDRDAKAKKKMYYDVDLGAGTGLCPHFPTIWVGSKNCMECHFNRQVGAAGKDWIYCGFENKKNK